MKNLEEIFFNKLTKEMNFFIKEYYDINGNNRRWIALYELKDFYIGVIITKEKSLGKDFIDSFNYMNSTLNKQCIIYKVVETEKSNIENELVDEYKIVYSTSLKKPIYIGEKASIFNDILYKLNSNKENRMNFDFKKYYITYMLMFINILIYILEIYFSGNLFNIDIYTLIIMGAKYNVLIDNGEIYRLVTAGFLHGGIIHLLFNMAALKSIGEDIEIYYGKIKYLIIYFLSLIGGTLASYIFSENSVSVGASGAIFGLLGATLIFAIKNKEKVSKKYFKSIVEVIVLNVLIGLSLSNIDNYAHLGGLLSGSIISFVIYRRKNN